MPAKPFAVWWAAALSLLFAGGAASGGPSSRENVCGDRRLDSLEERLRADRQDEVDMQRQMNVLDMRGAALQTAVQATGVEQDRERTRRVEALENSTLAPDELKALARKEVEAQCTRADSAWWQRAQAGPVASSEVVHIFKRTISHLSGSVDDRIESNGGHPLLGEQVGFSNCCCSNDDEIWTGDRMRCEPRLNDHVELNGELKLKQLKGELHGEEKDGQVIWAVMQALDRPVELLSGTCSERLQKAGAAEVEEAIASRPDQCEAEMASFFQAMGHVEMLGDRRGRARVRWSSA